MSADFSHASGINLAGQPDFEIGGLRIRPNLREVQAGTGTERLEPRVMQALVALAERPGEVLSRDALIERCWGGRIVGDDAINRCMTKLRKVGAEHGAFSIEAIPKVGYRLIVAASRADQGGAPVRASAPRRRWLWRALGAAVVALAGLVGVVFWRLAPEPLSTATPFVVTEITTARADDGLKSFAVTTTSDINAGLSRYHLPTTPAGRTRFEISGVVSSEAGRTRARLNLVALPSSTMIWSKEFDAPAADEAILRARIASRVATVADEVNEILVRPSSDFDAVTLALMIKGIEGISNNTWNSRTGPEEAVRRSPRSAVAHSSYAVALSVAAGYVAPDKAGDYRSRSSAELARARELDPQTPETIVLQTMMMLDGKDWSAMLKVASEPPRSESAYGKMVRGILMAVTGRARDGMLPLMDSMEVLGERPGRIHMLIYAMRAGGGDAGALDLARRKILLLPEDYNLRAALLDLIVLWGKPDEALAILDDTNRRPTNSTVSLKAYRRFVVWRRDEGAADRLAAIAAVTAAAKAGLPPETTVPMLVRLGDLTGAFNAAEAMPNPVVLYFADTAPMRRDPRFIALADKLGLLKFWRESGAWPDFCEREPDSICAQMQGR